MNSQTDTLASKTQEGQTRAGYVVVVGRPNVGKSTLINAILGQKLVITSPKPQTTRHRIPAILTREEGQIIFLDTPGLHRPTNKLQEAMVGQIQQALEGADGLIAMGDASQGEPPLNEEVLEVVRQANLPCLLVINKTDRVSPAELHELSQRYEPLPAFRQTIWISALQGDGVEEVVREIFNLLPSGQPYYPPDTLSDLPLRFFAAELIRETIFEEFGEEVPYCAAVVIEEYREEDARDYLRAEIIVEKESQKGILIGRGGEKLKRVGMRSRQRIEAFTEKPAFLDLWVRVRRGWRKRAEEVRRLGYRSV